MGDLDFALRCISTQWNFFLIVKATEQPTSSFDSTSYHIAKVQVYGLCRVQDEEAMEAHLETALERNNSQVQTKLQRLL